MTPMIPFMLDRTYNPGQLVIVREIKYSTSPDFDTAVFTGNLADYGILHFDDNWMGSTTGCRPTTSAPMATIR